jgi:hypothetical protein
MWIIVRVLIGIVVLFLLEFYFSRKLNRTVKTLIPKISDKKRKIFLSVFLVLLNLYPAILIFNAVYAAITKQSVSFPLNIFADYLLLYPFWILIIVILQVSVIFILIDVLRFILYPFYKKHRQKYFKYESILISILLLVFAIYVPARIIYDYNTVEVRSVDYKKKNLPKDLEGFKVAFISDVQADRYTDEKRLKRYIDKINASKPDLVLIAGDVITSTPDYITTAAKYIGMIKSTYGTYSCVGDHDNWAYRRDYARSLRDVIKSLNDFNVEMFDNKLHFIKTDSSQVGVTFITNTYVSDVPEATLKNLSSSNNADFKIFLTHQPQEFLINSAVKNNYDLFLAGHTHGGQITLLFPFIRLTPTIFETHYIKGNFNFGKTLAIICGGLGMSLAPIRYNSTPEIVIITLRSK